MSSSGGGGSGNKAGHIRATPLFGGRSDTGVCTLLELGGARLLLDCGASSPYNYAYLEKTAVDLVRAGGVDAIILSHADIHHVGALPILAGRKGLQHVPIICTGPVSKFAQISLYDYVLNMKMEGESSSSASSSSADAKSPARQGFDYEDIDHAFQHVLTVKYSQTIQIPQTRQNQQLDMNVKRIPIAISAIASGRTLGGSIWRIRCGPAEVLYTMDVNLRKEIVLNEAALDLLPTSPTLMITAAPSNVTRKKKDKDETQQMLALVMETVRNGGNVLIPCETAGRVFELMQILGKYWTDEKLGMYHLIFLSHMSRNVMDYVRSQMEWMSDSLTKPFYNGKPNPFELPFVKVLTTTKGLDKNYPGPKVVLATDASLCSGLSKELLVKWGGDPRCRVIFPDSVDRFSLAAELLAMAATPPIITTINRPIRVDLTGQELVHFQQEQEKLRREREEALQRKRRQQELSMLNVSQDMLGEGEEDDLAEAAAVAAAVELQHGDHIRKRVRINAKVSFLKETFAMFERRDPVFNVDEFGMSIDDLDFRDIQSSDSKWAVRERSDMKSKSTISAQVAAGEDNLSVQRSQALTDIARGKEARRLKPTAGKAALESSTNNAIDIHPWKIVSTPQRIQFTCEFRQFNLGGRADFKAIKSLLARVTPVKLFIVRGLEKDCDALVSYAKNNGIEAFAPSNRHPVSFQTYTERLRVQIQRKLVPSNAKVVKSSVAMQEGNNSSNSGSAVSSCTVCVLKGEVSIADVTNQEEGTRVVKYVGVLDKEAVTDVDTDGEVSAPQPAEDDGKLKVINTNIGVVSLGEIALRNLEQTIKQSGVQVEVRHAASGGVYLVCDDQVIIRKEDNNFSIEGPPIQAFFEARKALYQQVAFV